VSGWFVWLEVGLQGAGLAFAVYAAQLFLNAIWSGLFFGMRRIDLAMFEVVFLWLSILLNIIVFYPISAAAAWLLLPYLLWVSFAAFLNFVMLKLNPREAEEGA
jgi:tryptophan-rich sensory protein